MSAPKFTPGPWRVVKPPVGYNAHRVAHGDAAAGCDIPYSLGGIPVFLEADAHLTAAAPDLYAALEAMFASGTTEECHAGPCVHPACVLTRAALAKARGEA